MADTLAAPAEPGALILACGDEVNPVRPLYTGDIVTGTPIPLLQEDPLAVVVMSHPCAMRAGSALLEYLHVAPIVAHSESGPQMWRGNYKYMALDALADTLGLANPVVRLDRMTLIATGSLDPARRVACLDRSGVNILRQRLVHHLTRLVVDVAVLDREAGAAHEEVDLAEEWIEAATGVGVAVEQATEDLHAWIRAEGRQAKLGDPQNVPAIRRAARAEMRQRYQL